MKKFKPTEDCLRCGLYKGCRAPVPSRGSAAPDILIVGEAPGENEDVIGKPFVGRSGELLDSMLIESGIPTDRVRWTNACRCRPHNNQAPGPVQVNACHGRLMREIAKVKPKLIIPMGNTPCKSVLDKAGITALRGVLREIEVDGAAYSVLPTFHPAYALRDPTKAVYILQDLQRAAQLVSGKVEAPPETTYALVRTKQKALKELDRLSKLGKTLVAIDIESNSVLPFWTGFKVLTIAVSTEFAKSVCFDLREIDPYWFLPRLFSLENLRYVFHNGPFDACGIERYLKTPFPDHRWSHDTILMHAAVDENASHGLKVLTSVYIPEMAGYQLAVDEEEEEKGWEGIDLTTLAEYNNTDADMTRRLVKILWKELKEEKTTFVYREIMMPAIKVLRRISRNGLMIDTKAVDVAEAKYGKMLKDMEANVQGYPAVKECIARLAVKKMEKYNATHKNQKDDVTLFYEPFNPNSSSQKAMLLFDIIKLKPLKYSKITGSPSASKDVLEEYSGKNPICRKLKEYASISRLYTTYIKPVKSDWLDTVDGRTHSTYTLHVTVTGRTSSKRPNHENIPRPDTNPDIRNFFVAPKGKVLIEADYSQLELRLAAIYANDLVLIDAFNTGKDVHKILASKFYKKPEAEITKDERTRAKRTNFGVLYGMSADKLAGELDIKVSEAQGLIDTFFNTFKGVARWIKRTHLETRKTKSITSLIGRKRRLPAIDSTDRGMRSEAERQAVNSPIQGLGSDLLMLSIVRIQDELDKWNTSHGALLVATVHDSLLVECNATHKKRVAKLIRRIMTEVPSEFPWAKIPITVEIKSGTRWGSVEEVSW